MSKNKIESKTQITVFHINDSYSIGFHTCFKAPEFYYQQSGGDIYTYFVRNFKITNKNAVIDIIIQSMNTELVHVVPNGDYIEKWKMKFKMTLDDFLKAKVDLIEIIHEDYEIKHYLPHKQFDLNNDARNEFYEIYKNIANKNILKEIHNVKCLIWKVIKDEERNKKNEKYDV